MPAGKYLVRRFLRIQQALEEGGLEHVNRRPGAENPADSLTRVRSNTAPFLRRLEIGCFDPGSSRPLKGVAWKELVGHETHWNSSCKRTFKCFWSELIGDVVRVGA